MNIPYERSVKTFQTPATVIYVHVPDKVCKATFLTDTCKNKS